jgi:hypothetical protein
LRKIFVGVPAPGGETETVVFVPLHFHGIIFIDDGRAAALHGVVEDRAGVAVKAGLLPGLKHLQVTGHGEKSVAAVDRIFVLDVQAVVGIVDALFA